jgi:hypothetical protein
LTAYAFQEGVPYGFRADFQSGIFHHLNHVQVQSTSGLHSYVLVDQKKSTLAALIHVHHSNDEAVSPYRSPYGSFLFSDSLSEDDLQQFVFQVEQNLKDAGVKNFVLKNEPAAYAEKKARRLEQVLLKLNYQIISEETSSVIPVTDVEYASILHRTKKPRLKKCHEMGFEWQQVSREQLPEVYNFLNNRREEKGYSLSMELSALENVMEIFPEEFFLHVARHENKLIAASISIQVLPDVLYCFYYDHLPEYDAVSPIVFLCEGLYAFCQSKGIGLMDLGTSNPDGQLHEPLLDFKLSLGAEPSRKLTFAKKI